MFEILGSLIGAFFTPQGFLMFFVGAGVGYFLSKDSR